MKRYERDARKPFQIVFGLLAPWNLQRQMREKNGCRNALLVLCERFMRRARFEHRFSGTSDSPKPKARARICSDL